MAFLPGHSPACSLAALLGDQALNLEKAALQSGQTSWRSQQWRQIDLEDWGLAHSCTDLGVTAVVGTCCSGSQTYLFLVKEL